MSKHGWFAANLIAASYATSLIEAAVQWEFSHESMVASGTRGNCQLCHTPFVNFVVIKNGTSQIRLEIGSSCYKKLVRFRTLHRLESTRMRPLDEYRRELHEYAQQCAFQNAVLPWIRVQKCLPNAIREIVATFDRLGFPASMNDTELLVSYYRTCRFFPLASTRLIDPETRRRLERFPHRNLLPKWINLVGIVRLTSILTKWNDNEEEKKMREDRSLFHKKLARIFRGAPEGIVPFRATYNHPSLSLEVEFIYRNDRLVFSAVVWNDDPLRDYLLPDNAYSRGTGERFGVLEIETIVQSVRPQKIRFAAESGHARNERGRLVVLKKDALPWSIRARTRAGSILLAQKARLASMSEKRANGKWNLCGREGPHKKERAIPIPACGNHSCRTLDVFS